MKIVRLVIFTLVLVALATTCKYFFSPILGLGGFSPIIAIALFSGLVIRERNLTFMLPLVALLASDLIIQLLYEQGRFPYEGIYDGQWKNYLIILSATVIGWLIKGRSKASLLVGAIAAPTVFFLLSNLNVWLSQEVGYSKDFSGLMNCYAAGLPFYRNALIATLVFFPSILLLYNYITRHRAVLTIA